MNRIIFIWVFISICSFAQAQIQKSDLRVLYVGGSANTSVSDTIALKNEVCERMASFEEMLKRYFRTVKVVDAKDYHYSMSEQYDVTVIDGIPRPILPGERGKHSSGRMVVTKAAGYLPEDFDRPVLFIAEMGERLGRRIGLKIDWYCLCLDAEAHSIRMEHPIFHGPFPVNLTMQMRPTPSDAFHYAYFMDSPLPDSIPMWRVQTKGYMSQNGYRAGMVSRPWGFADSPDVEYISSGVCAKTLDAIALGRHGNFFHWGFVSSPADLTEEAQTVLANAIVYIAGFAGQTPIARKYVDRVATREYIKELKYFATKAGWQEREALQKEFEQIMLKMKENAQMKQKKGEKLNKEEELDLSYMPDKPLLYADFLKQYQKELFDRFGENEMAYIDYYDRNYDYFYGGEGIYKLTIDEDVKSLGIPNNDQRLLDQAISMLEKGTDVAKANRILMRYTLCRFTTPKEWRDWFETNKKRLFFTEAGGWLFMVNTRDAVAGNDYHVRDSKVVPSVVSRDETTDNENPVQVIVDLNKLDNGNREIVIRMKIHPGYHVYAHVSESDPYIPTSVEIALPEGFRIIGQLKRSSFRGFNDRGTTIYEKEAIFRQEIAGEGGGDVVCIVNFQCCDSQICMPPMEKKFTLKIQ